MPGAPKLEVVLKSKLYNKVSFMKFLRVIFNNSLVRFLLIILPVVFSLIIFFLVDASKSNMLLIFNNIYYLAMFCIYLIFKRKNSENLPRSPIQFIKKFNFTNNKFHWDEFQKPLRHLTGVEVGVFKGEHALKIYKYLNIKNLYLVDPYKEYIDSTLGKNDPGCDQKKHDENYLELKKKFSNYKNVNIIRTTSLEASKKFEDNSLDFVYIDGDHSYEGVKLDLESWYPKLKEFGVMGGDDYGHISGKGVVKAVNEFAYNKKVVVIYGNDNQFYFVKTI